ncbi:oligosaccharide flippase family protein [Psychrobacter sanguinis]|uniref:oligosaccharide flippase family protein n=1 Tax=Psychrobacter sanguinis TaxID=861445 RepID=UPI0028A70AA8|nr:oligosaccharide flippase family protein [Psychrobacter sanguinis]
MLTRALKSQIAQNIIALSFVQVVNFLLPLILIPYLLKTLGTQGWGKIAYAQFLLQYFVVVVTYGYQWSAVNRIAPVRHNINQVNRMFSSYWISQWFLLLISLIILIIAIALFIDDKLQKLLLSMGFLSVVGTVIFPVWMMQALEKLKEMAIVQFIVQIFCFVLIYNFVNDKDDIVLAMFLQSINNIISGLICIFLLYRQGYKLVKITSADIYEALKDGFDLFTSQIWISLYTNTIPIVLGYTASASAVATYAVADKVQKAVRFVLNPIGRALFPRISYLIKGDKKQANKILKLSLLFTTLITFMGGFVLFLFPSFFVKLLGGEELSYAKEVIRIFSIMPMLVGLSGTLAIQGLIPLGKQKDLNIIWFLSAFITLILVYPVCKYYGVVGAASLAVSIELFTVLSMFYFIKR